MGIEALGSALGSVGRVASVAPAIGRVASIGPSIGRIGPSLEGGFSISGASLRVSRIANPFRGGIEAINDPFKAVAKSVPYAENRPFSPFRPMVEVIKNPFKEPTTPKLGVQPLRARVEPLSVPAVVVEAEAIVKKAQAVSLVEPKIRPLAFVRTPEPAIVRLPNPTRIPHIASQVEPKVQVVSQLATEGRATNRLIRVTSAAVQPQVQAEEVIEKKQVVVKDQKTQKPEVKRSEKTSQFKVTLVEAVKVSERRRQLLRVAWERAVQTGEKLTLRLIRKFLIWSKEDLSPIVRNKGIDGTIKLTNEALESDTTGYSPQEAEKRAVSLVAEYKPVEEGEGNPVTFEEVRQVLEGKEAEVTRVNTAAEIVKKRVTRLSEVVKGGVIIYSSEEKVETQETSLKDFPVVFRESVLPKVA